MKTQTRNTSINLFIFCILPHWLSLWPLFHLFLVNRATTFIQHSQYPLIQKPLPAALTKIVLHHLLNVQALYRFYTTYTQFWYICIYHRTNFSNFHVSKLFENHSLQIVIPILDGMELHESQDLTSYISPSFQLLSPELISLNSLPF